MPTKLLTAVNDREIIDGAIATYVDAGGLADRYTVSPTLSGDATIQDTDGGLIVLPAGFTFDSVQFTASGIRFTQGDNTVTFTGSSNFSVVLAGNPLNDAAGTTLTAAQFADEVGATIGGPAVAGGTVAADGTIGDGGNGPTPTGTSLTVGVDALTGGAGDDVFVAPLAQNFLGAVTNTFESGDSIDGGGGRNRLEADLTAVVSGTVPVGPAVSAATVNVQEVFLRYQFPITDFATNNNGFATIDAQRMVGVEQWWSNGSRNDIVLEDVRSNPLNTTFGFRSSDPSVSYRALFSPEALEGFVDLIDSALTVTLIDVNEPANELALITVNSLTFQYEGVEYTLMSDAISDADTYAELAAALQAAINAEAGLAGLTTRVDTSGLNPVIVIEDPAGGDFGADSAISFVNNTTGLVAQGVEPGAPVQDFDLITTNIVLDNVGRGSEGGVMQVGSMSTRGGVEVFDVTVDRSSWLQVLTSTNNALEEVFVTSAAGSTGYLFLGTGTESAAGLNLTQRVPTTTDNRLATNGLTDVRLFDSTAFNGALKLGANLSGEIFDKYLIGASDVVEFEYLFGDGGNNFTLNLNENIARDRDFSLTIVGGDGDDRFNFVGNTTKSTVSVDGGAGFNTVEVTTTTNGGATATGTTSAFREFLNVQKLVVAGDNNTIQNIVTGNMDDAGLEQIVIATTGGANTTIQRMLIDTELVISGKNSTVGPGNNNNDQDFGVISIEGTRALPGDTELEITLENTARLDGVLTVDAINVIDQDIAPAGPGPEDFISGAGSVVLDSGARDARDQLNRVSEFNAIRTGDLTLIGDVNLGINVASLGATPGSSVIADTTIDASGLDGRLTLAVNANGVLNNSDDDQLIGAAGMADWLVLYGNGVDLDPTVSAFETVQFGWSGGRTFADTNVAEEEFGLAGSVNRYDASNTLGVNTYVLGNLSDNIGVGSEFILTGLRNNDTVRIGDTTAPNGQVVGGFGQIITLDGPGSINSVLNINAVSQLSALNYVVGGIDEFNVSGFGTINANIARPADSVGGTVTYNIPARLDNEEFGLEYVTDSGVPGTDPFFGPSTIAYVAQPGAPGAGDVLRVDGILQNLVLTGGSALVANVDDLTFSEVLPASIRSIDVSGYNGAVTFALENAVVNDPLIAAQVNRANSDTSIRVQALYDIDVTLTALAGPADASSVDFNTVFVFTGAPAFQIGGMPAVTWTIDNFVASAYAGATVDNFSILDLRGLGITGLAGLSIVDDGGDAVITADVANPTWEIVLLDTPIVDLGVSENFIFAS